MDERPRTADLRRSYARNGHSSRGKQARDADGQSARYLLPATDAPPSPGRPAHGTIRRRTCHPALRPAPRVEDGRGAKPGDHSNGAAPARAWRVSTPGSSHHPLTKHLSRSLPVPPTPSPDARAVVGAAARLTRVSRACHTAYLYARPRSSGDRAPPSGGGSAGSNPVGGTTLQIPYFVAGRRFWTHSMITKSTAGTHRVH